MLVKRLLFYTVSAVLIFLTCYYLHSYILVSAQENPPFELLNIYLFLAIAALVLVVFFELLASLSGQFKDQLGFLYLGAMALKIMLFCVVFRGFLFTNIVLSKLDSISLLIPIFIFIFFEVVIIAKILNRSA